MDLLLQVGIIISTLLVLLYFYIREKFRYFSKRGLPYIKPKTILGNAWKSVLLRENIMDSICSLYNERKKGDGLFGIFYVVFPMLIVADLELAEQIFIKDFSHFYDRVVEIDEEMNPLEGHMFNLKGAKWRTIRNKLSPTFTSGKLRGMHPLMDSCVEDFLKVLETDKSQEMKSLFGRLTLHIIGSCAFGIESDVLKNENSTFLSYSNRISNPGLLLYLKSIIPFMVPGIRVKTFPDDMNRFFFGLVQQGFEHRRKENYVRNDFLQLLWELKKKGEVKKDKYEADDDEDMDLSVEHNINDDSKIVLSDAVLTAQAFVFIVGGHETTSATLAFLSYFLSKNKAAQERAREEARMVKEKHSFFNYDALKDLVYIEACIKEILRLYPPVPSLARQCTKPIKLGKYHIQKGTAIFIPIRAIQRDPEYFPEPEIFRPERFLETDPPPFSYLPFGTGPRICIGQRFAMMEMKLLIARLLCHFSMEVSPKMAANEPIKLETMTFISIAKGGIHCILKKLEQ